MSITTITLNKPFASNSPADNEDVMVMKRILNRLGYYTPYEKVGLIDMPDKDVFAALKAFQKDKSLPVTGKAKPEDETIKALNEALGEQITGDE